MSVLQVWRLSADRRRLESGDRPPKTYSSTPTASTDRVTRLRGSYTAPVVTAKTDRVTRLRGVATAPAPPVTGGPGLLPAGSMTRPSGANYVRYEDVFVAGDTLQQTANRVTGNRILTFPAGVFEFQDFANGYYDGIRVGAGGATGCRGFAGSGPDQTIFRMTAGSSTKQAFVAGLTGTTANPLFLINAAGPSGAPITGVEFSNLKIEGTLQGSDHAFGGLRFEYCTAPKVTNVLITGVKGFANVPPGETMSISVFRGSGITIRNCEIDGRRGTTRVSASPIGLNNTTNTTVDDTYVHHALTGGGGIAYYYTNDSVTHNFRSEYIGTAGSTQAGYCINHEESTRITHYSPVLVCDRGASNPGGLHMSLNSDVAGLDCILTVINPTWDATAVGGGKFCVERWSSSIGQSSKPRVFQSDGVTPLVFTAIGFP